MVPTEPYAIADEIFRYVHDNDNSLITEIEEYVWKVFGTGHAIRPALAELETAGLIHINSQYVSMKPKGSEVIIKHGLYSYWLKSIEDENKLSTQLIKQQIEEYYSNNWYKRKEFILSALGVLLAAIAIALPYCKKS
ncbi:MAG: hypothetical protein ABI675_01025 [Chitinophagaceae bacterium]